MTYFFLIYLPLKYWVSRYQLNVLIHPLQGWEDEYEGPTESPSPSKVSTLESVVAPTPLPLSVLPPLDSKPAVPPPLTAHDLVRRFMSFFYIHSYTMSAIVHSPWLLFRKPTIQFLSVKYSYRSTCLIEPYSRSKVIEAVAPSTLWLPCNSLTQSEGISSWTTHHTISAIIEH